VFGVSRLRTASRIKEISTARDNLNYILLSDFLTGKDRTSYAGDMSGDSGPEDSDKGD